MLYCGEPVKKCLVSHYDVDPRFHVPPKQPHDDPLRALTIGAEGAPLVLLESMACGVPFVANKVGGIPDYAIDNPNVLVVPPTPEDFIKGVKQMVYLLDAGKINRVVLQQFYLRNYSYDSLKNAWLRYFSQ
jgi:glycosyltransferase involved in cell wall biosynthesis